MPTRRDRMKQTNVDIEIERGRKRNKKARKKKQEENLQTFTRRFGSSSRGIETIRDIIRHQTNGGIKETKKAKTKARYTSDRKRKNEKTKNEEGRGKKKERGKTMK